MAATTTQIRRIYYDGSAFNPVACMIDLTKPAVRIRKLKAASDEQVTDCHMEYFALYITLLYVRDHIDPSEAIELYGDYKPVVIYDDTRYVWNVNIDNLPMLRTHCRYWLKRLKKNRDIKFKWVRRTANLTGRIIEFMRNEARYDRCQTDEIVK